MGLYQAVILLKYKELFVCCPTPQLSLKLGLDLIINSILCTPNVPSFIGMSVKVWKKVNFLKLEKILLLWKKIMKRLVSIQLKAKVRRKITSTKSCVFFLF